MNQNSLAKEDIERYSRQLLLPEFGVECQEKLQNARVLVVGAGGLGCPVALYLSASGLGTLGLVDYDNVELNNLHRQVGHSEEKVNTPKVESLKKTCLSLNSKLICSTFNCQLDKNNASAIISDFDLVCDCSDNAATRYLINDACVFASKPLVSGSALRWEGQLTVYNVGDGPCYRCLFPIPPPADTVVSCSEGGVLGPIPGIIGNMQALEALKMVTGIGTSYSRKMLLFDGLRGQFRTVTLRGKNIDCPICGPNRTITELIDYEAFCGAGACDKIITVKKLPKECRISVDELSTKLKANEKNFFLVDCRPEHEYKICSLQCSHSLPLEKIRQMSSDEVKRYLESISLEHVNEVLVICHRGNDSQHAVLLLKEKLNGFNIKDVAGGLDEWATNVESNFPRY